MKYEMANCNTVISISILLFKFVFQNRYKAFQEFLRHIGLFIVSLREIVVSGEDALQVADALTSSSLRVLQLLSKERLDVSTIAERLKLSQPYISEQVRKLEEAKLVRVSYGRGKRGVRKICELAVTKIVIVIRP
jgi:DNA-binding MarR family transcriptional regulator